MCSKSFPFHLQSYPAFFQLPVKRVLYTQVRDAGVVKTHRNLPGTKSWVWLYELLLTEKLLLFLLSKAENNNNNNNPVN